MLAIGQSPRSFAQRVAQFLERVEYRRAETEAELDAILRLRYDAYLNEGAISASPSRLLPDAFDDVDNVYNFGIFIDGELGNAIRLHVLSGIGQQSPALESFGEFLFPELRAGKLIVDPNRFVADYRLARLYPELPYVTLRLTYLACQFFAADVMTMTVRAEHEAFYRRGFFARSVCPPRPYPLLSKHIGLMFIDFPKDAERLAERYPFSASSAAEREALFAPGLTLSRARGTSLEAPQTAKPPFERVRNAVSAAVAVWTAHPASAVCSTRADVCADRSRAR
jgi:hypothetical protein